MTATDVAILWAGAIATLGVYSILYRENPVSRLFEHIFIGLAMGYTLAITWTLNLYPKWWTPMVSKGQWPWVFAPVVGLLFYFIYSRKLLWMARLAMAIFFGQAAGVYFREFFPLYSPQVWSSFKPLTPILGVALPPSRPLVIPWGHETLFVITPPPLLLAWLDVITHNWLFVIILLTVMSYFFFSVRHEAGPGKALRASSSVGRWFLMIAFGAMFGNTVMARLSLFIGRVQFLLQDWLGPTFQALFKHLEPLLKHL